MNENSPKNVLSSSYQSTLNGFIQLCEEHCATVWHISKIFIPFSFRFIFSPFNTSNFRCVLTKTIILLWLAKYERIITNSALRASLVIYYLIYSARPRRIIVNYYINFSRLSRCLTLWKHETFPCENRCKIFTCAGICDVMCATKFGPFKCWMNLNCIIIILILFTGHNKKKIGIVANDKTTLKLFGKLQKGEAF